MAAGVGWDGEELRGDIVNVRDVSGGGSGGFKEAMTGEGGGMRGGRGGRS